MTNHPGPSSLRPVPRLRVTPDGQDRSVWRTRLQRNDRWDLEQLCTRIQASPGTRLLVAGAHPDDETLGAGRLIAAWARRIGPVSAVVASAGEACLDHLGRRPVGIAERRIAEWRAAAASLGVQRCHPLGLPDGQLHDHQETLRAALAELLEDRIVVAAPWPGDPHPDHRACGLAALGAADAFRGQGRRVSVIGYPVWMTYWTDPDAPELDGASLIDLQCGPDAEHSFADAIAAYTSQLTPLAEDLDAVVPQAMLAHQDRQLIFLEHTGHDTKDPGQ